MSRKPSQGDPPAALPSHRLTISPSLSGGLLAWLMALLGARWLMPTEGAAEGMTLWLVQLVLFTALARAVWVWRFDERPFHFDAMDGAIALLIAAQVVSALAVVLGVGNSRAAINLAWEWIGSGVLIWWLRQELRSVRIVRAICLGLSLTAGVLAGYGLWQHYVEYDATTREYERLTAEHDRLAQSGSDGRRLQELRATMARQGISVEPDARRSLEQRLKFSREPFGLFALANTFAGLLAVMLLISAGTQRGPFVGIRRHEWIATALLGAVMAFCLVLTKSRTAWVGLLAGIGWWVCRVIAARWRQGTEKVGRSFATWIVVGLVVVGFAVGTAAVSGGLDKAVLSEAPKSLRYRLEYWQGTWATIREHFWLGTGPGNFRDHYLAHKLPESSEEIADPHNFILDVWANAGTFGLIGLLVCIGLMVGQVRNLPVRQENKAGQVENLPYESTWTSAGVWGVGLAFPLSAIGLEMLGHGTDERLWWLGGIWWGIWLVGVVWSWRRGYSLKPDAQAKVPSNVPSLAPQAFVWLPISLEAANVALLVHLLGAGGIAMPAITQLFWLVWALRWALSESSVAASDQKSPSDSALTGVLAGRVSAGVCALAAGGLCVICFLTATMPELLCRTSLQSGDWEWGHRQTEAAQARYQDAAKADPWAIDPLERLADLSFQRWQQTKLDADFEEAARWLPAVIDRLPFASRPHRRLGQAWLARFEQSRDPDHAKKAVEAFAAAVERYPHHAELLSEWAQACAAAGFHEQAREIARRAIRQDDVNRQAGHSDKFLNAKVRSRLDELATES